MGTYKDIPPDKLLPSGPGQNSFSVPDDYFDFLPERIMDRIHSKSKQRHVFFLLKPSFAIPSFTILSGLIIFLIYFLHTNEVTSDEMLFSEKEIQVIIDDPGLYNIGDEVITDQYLPSDISYTSLTGEPGISDEEIKLYLEENTNTRNEY